MPYLQTKKIQEFFSFGTFLESYKYEVPSIVPYAEKPNKQHIRQIETSEHFSFSITFHNNVSVRWKWLVVKKELPR